jgi:hypothetical protein
MVVDLLVVMAAPHKHQATLAVLVVVVVDILAAQAVRELLDREITAVVALAMVVEVVVVQVPLAAMVVIQVVAPVVLVAQEPHQALPEHLLHTLEEVVVQ